MQLLDKNLLVNVSYAKILYVDMYTILCLLTFLLLSQGPLPVAECSFRRVQKDSTPALMHTDMLVLLETLNRSQGVQGISTSMMP